MNFTDELDGISEQIHHDFESRSAARDAALARSRLLTRQCANAIRAIHRDEGPARPRAVGVYRLRQQLLRHIRVGFAFGGAGDLSHEPLDDGLFASEELFHFFWIIAQDFFDGFLNETCV